MEGLILQVALAMLAVVGGTMVLQNGLRPGGWLEDVGQWFSRTFEGGSTPRRTAALERPPVQSTRGDAAPEAPTVATASLEIQPPLATPVAASRGAQPSDRGSLNV
ncbi:MAG: hypothetical protein K2Q12_11515 [Rickettsiales bacterium]|nr:hypothetical protein [Rickettsiales bacterium]